MDNADEEVRQQGKEDDDQQKEPDCDAGHQLHLHPEEIVVVRHPVSEDSTSQGHQVRSGQVRSKYTRSGRLNKHGRADHKTRLKGIHP